MIIIFNFQNPELNMKIVTHSLSAARQRGFSLFEVMMFVAILGVMTSLAVPMLVQSDSVYAARDRRNAQELSSTSMMAQAAGLNFVQGDDVVEILRALARGDMPSQGPMRGRLFMVPGLSEEDLARAAKFLTIRDGQLMYSNREVPILPGGQHM